MVPELTVTPIKRSRMEVYLHVLRALMLRDMRTRFDRAASPASLS